MNGRVQAARGVSEDARVPIHPLRSFPASGNPETRKPGNPETRPPGNLQNNRLPGLASRLSGKF